MSTRLQRAERLSEKKAIHPTKHREIVITERNREILALKAKLRKATRVVRAVEAFQLARQEFAWISPVMVAAANELSLALVAYKAKV